MVLFLLDQVLLVSAQLISLVEEVVVFFGIGLPFQLCVADHFVLLDSLGFLRFVGRKVHLLVLELQLLFKSRACVDGVYFLEGSPDFPCFIWLDLIAFLLLLL